MVDKQEFVPKDVPKYPVLFPTLVSHPPSLRRWTWGEDERGVPLTPHEDFWRRWELDGWQPELWEG